MSSIAWAGRKGMTRRRGSLSWSSRRASRSCESTARRRRLKSPPRSPERVPDALEKKTPADPGRILQDPLTKVPMELQGEDGAGLNNDKICISPSSPQVVIDAFGVQFQRDFEKFLRCRSEELVANGRMVLVLMGRRGGAGAEAEPYHIPMDLLGQALNDMAAEGLVEKEKIMTFNIAYYSPSAEEVMDVVAREGSFSIKFMDFFDIDMVEYQNQRSSTNDGAYEHHLGVRKHARSVRAVFESLLETLVHEDLIDDLFTRYEKIVHKYCLQKKVLMVNLIVTLEKEA